MNPHRGVAIEATCASWSALRRRLLREGIADTHVVGEETSVINPRAGSLDGGHSHRLRTFRPLGDLELDSLSLLKGAKPVPFYFRMVDKHIFFATVGRDEPEPLRGVEPFHSSLWHTNFSLLTKMDLI